MNADVMGPKIDDCKVISRGYGSISHLKGSKMIDDRDKLIGEQEEKWLTVARRNPLTDIVFITEKVDGMNVAVYKRNGKLYPINRFGYDVRTSSRLWQRMFARYVEDNADSLSELLDDGQRLCGEWMIKTHTIPYKLKTAPFIVFDIIDDRAERMPYFEFRYRVENYGFTPAALIHAGTAMPTGTLYKLYLTKKLPSCHGAAEGMAEGYVYKYESAGKYICSAKYVIHPVVGNTELFNAHINNPIFNAVPSKFRKYIPYEG